MTMANDPKVPDPLAGQADGAPRWPTAAVFFTVSRLAAMARLAVERTQPEENGSEFLLEQHDAPVAIIMSAVTLEAFINQYGSFAEYLYAKEIPAQSAAMESHLSQLLDRTNASPLEREQAWAVHNSMPPLIDVPPSVKSFGAMLGQLEESHAGIEAKYMWASICLRGEPYTKGIRPFQDFQFLITLRNLLVHPRIEGWFGYMDSDVEPLLNLTRVHRELISRQLMPTAVAPEWMSLFELLSTRKAARWAFNTAATMIKSVLDMTPSGAFKDTFDRSLDAILKPV
jgi:hypothetical protein